MPTDSLWSGGALFSGMPIGNIVGPYMLVGFLGAQAGFQGVESFARDVGRAQAEYQMVSGGN